MLNITKKPHINVLYTPLHSKTDTHNELALVMDTFLATQAKVNNFAASYQEFLS